MPETDVRLEFAALLEALKIRSGRSYHALAGKLGLSQSTLHRYCTGQKLPADVRLIARLVRVCGASHEEATALLKAWQLADAVHRLPTSTGQVAAEPPDPVLLPRNDLPRDIGDFVGRRRELERLLAADPSGRAADVTAIDGMAGVGKTTLAVHAAHRLTDRYPDGRLFLDLHGHTDGVRPMSAADALEALLCASGVPYGRIPGPVEQRVSLWRSTLAGRRMLVVLDNAADTAQVTPLLPGESRCLTLITSRDRLTDLDAVRTLTLEVLETDEATAMFDEVLGPAAGGDPSAVAESVRLCGGLPLAIRIVTARLRHHSVWTTEHLNQRLRTEHRRLAELRSGSRSVEAAFALSYHRLTPKQRRMFRLLGLYPGAEIDLRSAAALADLPTHRAARLLEGLVDAHVLHQSSADRYRFHDLVRDHARTLVASREPESEREAALCRLLDYFLHTADQAAAQLEPGRRLRPPVPAGRPRHAEEPVGRTAAIAWLDRERTTLVAAIDVAVRTGHNSHGWRLAGALWHYFLIRGNARDWLQTHFLALTAVRRTGHRQAEAETLKNLGLAHWLSGDDHSAIDRHEQALAIDREMADAGGEAKTLTHLGFIHNRQGAHELAADEFDHAVALYRELEDPSGTNRALAGRGDALRQSGRPADGFLCLWQALSLSTGCGDRWGETVANSGLGFAHLDGGCTDLARLHFGRALALSRQTGDRWGETLANSGLGFAHLGCGGTDLARLHFGRALVLSRQTGDRWGEAMAAEGFKRTAVPEGHGSANGVARHRGNLRDLPDVHDRNPG